MFKLKHLFKSIFSPSYKYYLYKAQKDKELAEKMAAHPENFYEDEYWIWETKRDADGKIIGSSGKLKSAPPPVSPEIKQMFEDIGKDLKKEYG